MGRAVADSSVTARLAACRNTEPGALLGRAAAVLWKTKKNESMQRRIARSLARVHELKADPARLDLDQAARLIGRLTEQRNMLAKAPGGT
jgi:hypothetical protein